jgi:hypothetical protein
MKISKEELKEEWESWAGQKPWYCPKCNMLLSGNEYSECDGTDPDLPEEDWSPHETTKATASVSFSQFSEIVTKWYEEIEEPEPAEETGKE